MSASAAAPFAGLLALAGVYALAARRSPGWPVRRIGYALVGLLALGASGSLTGGTLAVDMIGHAMIVAVAAPLLILARPLALVHRYLRPPARERLRRQERRIGGWLEPWTCWVAFIAVQWWFHLGPLAEAARGEGVVHALEHGLFFATALAFWSAALAPVPGMRRMGAPERAGYLLAAMPALDLIGAIWIGQGMEAAGVAMIGGMLPIGIAFLIVAGRAMAAEERTARTLEQRRGRGGGGSSAEPLGLEPRRG